MLSASRLLWCILAKSRGQPEYNALVAQLREMLETYIEKAIISEYFALMVVELLGFTEVSHYQQVATRLLPGREAGAARMIDESIRAEVRRRMEAEGDLLSLTYQLGSKGTSIGTEHRLRVIICNQEQQGYQRIREQPEALISTDAKGHSLLDFSRNMPQQQVNTELGLYNLSYLQRECEKQKCGQEERTSDPSMLAIENLAFALYCAKDLNEAQPTSSMKVFV